MNRTIAFATCKDQPALTPDDALAADAVRSIAQADVVAINWGAADIAWEEFDAVVIRSTWDYFRRADDFTQWLDDLERRGARLFNAAEVARWNAEKTYPRQLATAGIPIVPTVWFPQKSGADLASTLFKAGWSKAVVKPTVSCSAFETWITSPRDFPNEADQKRFDNLVRSSGVMIQPFMEEITKRGEWSLVFFDGVYSHAVLKQPSSGDFRVQMQFGGSWRNAFPSAELIEQAEHAVSAAVAIACEDKPLYARVDGLESAEDGRLLLMELELVEPSLFFAADADHAPSRFVRALADRIGKAVSHIYLN